MSVWIELHCDVRSEGQDPHDILQSRCWEMRNDNPAAMFADSCDGRRAVAMVKSYARKQGFKRLRDGRWSCPGCIPYAKEAPTHD